MVRMYRFRAYFMFGTIISILWRNINPSETCTDAHFNRNKYVSKKMNGLKLFYFIFGTIISILWRNINPSETFQQKQICMNKDEWFYRTPPKKESLQTKQGRCHWKPSHIPGNPNFPWSLFQGIQGQKNWKVKLNFNLWRCFQYFANLMLANISNTSRL